LTGRFGSNTVVRALSEKDYRGACARINDTRKTARIRSSSSGAGRYPCAWAMDDAASSASDARLID
jgi:hypothetical protein